jgi:hypothetical protein
MDMMMPQGTQKITARKTVGFCERQDIDRERVIHTTIQDDGRASVGWEGTDTGSTQGDRDEKDSEVRILRNLTVVPHEASVDVLAVGKGRFTIDQVLEASNDLTTVVKDGVGDGSSVNGEEHAVDEGVAGGEVSWRVSLVTLLVEHGVVVDDPQDLVT